MYSIITKAFDSLSNARVWYQFLTHVIQTQILQNQDQTDHVNLVLLSSFPEEGLSYQDEHSYKGVIIHSYSKLDVITKAIQILSI